MLILRFCSLSYKLSRTVTMTNPSNDLFTTLSAHNLFKVESKSSQGRDLPRWAKKSDLRVKVACRQTGQRRRGMDEEERFGVAPALVVGCPVTKGN